jgi:hypothetical protein
VTVTLKGKNWVTLPGALTAKWVAVGVALGVGVGVGVTVGLGVGVDVDGRSSVIVVAVAALPRKGSPYTCSIVRRTLK